MYNALPRNIKQFKMFEVEAMEHYSQCAEAQINYVTYKRSQYELDL